MPVTLMKYGPEENRDPPRKVVNQLCGDDGDALSFGASGGHARCVGRSFGPDGERLDAELVRKARSRFGRGRSGYR